MLSDSERSAQSDDSDAASASNEQIDHALQAVDQARLQNTAALPQALETAVGLLIRDGQFETAAHLAGELLALETNTSRAVDAMIALGACSAQKGQLDQAAGHFLQAADVSRRINYPLGVARALHLQTRYVLIPRGSFHLALSLLEEAGVLLEDQGSTPWDGPFLRGLIFQIVGDRRHCRQVLDELMLQVEPGTRMAAAYYFLWARLTLDEGELGKAREYLGLCQRVSSRVGKTDLKLMTGLEFSRYHRMQNEAAAARNWANNTLQHAQQLGLDYFAGMALLERAQANWASNDNESALADLAAARALLEPIGAAYDLSRERFLRALWLQQSGHPEAEAAWLEAVSTIIRDGYAFILEKNQELAFPLIAAYNRSKNARVRKATEEMLRHLASVPPPPLRIHTLGQFAVWKGWKRIPDQVWNRRKGGELLRFLLLQPTLAAGREVIIEALWPDHASDSPGDLLHQATSALRHALEPDLPDKFPSRYLKVEGDRIALILPHGSEVDFVNFERVLPLAISSGSPDRLQDALKLYSGELFPSDRYADWSTEQRQALAELHQRGLLALAQACLQQDQHYQAITICRQILHADAWNEDAVLLAMQAYTGLQDVPHALKMYLDLKQTLKEDLGITPRADLTELANNLRQR